ncbi:hypothetical protein AZZ89_004330, partial [Enterobacter hormaechei]
CICPKNSLSLTRFVRGRADFLCLNYILKRIFKIIKPLCHFLLLGLSPDLRTDNEN